MPATRWRLGPRTDFCSLEGRYRVVEILIRVYAVVFEKLKEIKNYLRFFSLFLEKNVVVLMKIPE